jgi:CheY-like chemotaxis protein
MSAEDLTNLDFTQFMPSRAATPVVPPAPAVVTAPESSFRADAEIGRLGTGHAGNYINYARAGLVPRPPAADAPIVVVEDDEITRQLLAKALTVHGYPVRSAADGRQFQTLMRTPPLPRLILLDVELPHINGFKILSVLRQHPQTGGIPLVMLTARTESKDLLHAMSLGADGYLSKPVTVAALRAMVDRLLRKN